MHLGAYSSIFSDAASVAEPLHGADTEEVTLSESGVILRFLLRFIYRQPPPLNNEAFTTLYELANVAEKYEVYAAIPACQAALRYVVTVFISKCAN